MLGNIYDHEVRVYVSNGSVAHFTLREMHLLYRTWEMWLLVLVGFFIMSTGHPVTLPQFDSFGLRMAFWIFALLIYLTASLLYSKLTCTLWRRLFGGPIPLIILSTPLLMASTYTASAVLAILFEPDRNPFTVMTWQMNVRNIIVAHIFETVALLWIIPAQRARRAKTDTRRKVTLAGRSFFLSDIERVKAAEHYLELYGETGSETIRERMSTFLEQVNEEEGIQTHRSHWVSRKAGGQYQGGKICLPCGVKVPVARGRQQEVRSWLQQDSDTGEVA